LGVRVISIGSAAQRENINAGWGSADPEKMQGVVPPQGAGRACL